MDIRMDIKMLFRTIAGEETIGITIEAVQIDGMPAGGIHGTTHIGDLIEDLDGMWDGIPEQVGMRGTDLITTILSAHGVGEGIPCDTDMDGVVTQIMDGAAPIMEEVGTTAGITAGITAGTTAGTAVQDGIHNPQDLQDLALPTMRMLEGQP
jgi:hypothetical protein